MWHDLLWHGYTGVPSHCANSRQGPQMCADLLGAAAKWDAHHSLALQMCLTTARLSASLGSDQIHTEECSLRLSMQQPRDVGTHTHTYTQIQGHIHRHSHIWNHFWKEVISSVERHDGEGIFFFFFLFSLVFWICAGKAIRDEAGERVWIQNSFNGQKWNLFLVWPNYNGKQWYGMPFVDVAQGRQRASKMFLLISLWRNF